MKKLLTSRDLNYNVFVRVRDTFGRERRARMFDNGTRTLVSSEYVERLRRAAPPMRARPRRARRSLGDWMIRVGERLSREPAPPCREVSFRACTPRRHPGTA